MRQAGFADNCCCKEAGQYKRERFLAEMDAVVPWTRLLSLIEPYYPKGERGRPPMGLETMLRVYFVQQWYALSDPLVEESLYDSESALALISAVWTWATTPCRTRARSCSFVAYWNGIS